jgi:lipopolysaccharide export system protein LptA
MNNQSPFMVAVFSRATFVVSALCVVVAVWVVWAATPSTAWAEKADRAKPMNIEADALRYDDLNQVSIFSGGVLLTKGSIQIRGQQVEVRQDPQGNQYGRVTGSADKLAFFRQKREGLDEYIEGEAELLEYDGKADTVKFTKKAQLRRYRGTVLADEISGGVIVYDNLSDMFSVDGNASKGAVAGAPKGRVRAMLTPKPEPGVAAAAAAAASTAPSPVLRASPHLEGAPK